jgi:hypothetical protein
MTRTLFRTAEPPDFRQPNRPPDGYAIIDKEGRIMGGHNIPLLQHQVLYDCLASYQDYKALKKAILASRPGAPTHTRIRIHHHHCTPTALIRVDPIHTHHLIGAWQCITTPVIHPITSCVLC